MLRWNPVMIAVLVAVLLPLTAHAETLKLIGGDFVFTHAPVDLEAPEGFSPSPPALLFSVTSDSFDGTFVTKDGGIPPKANSVSFVGYGDAEGWVYLYPEAYVPSADDLLATFTGSFTWQTAEGDLRGSFLLLDFPTEIEFVFAAHISITFDGGTGRYKNARGEAFAEGLDFPFGLGGDPLAAGVAATITQGELRLKKSKK